MLASDETCIFIERICVHGPVLSGPVGRGNFDCSESDWRPTVATTDDLGADLDAHSFRGRAGGIEPLRVSKTLELKSNASASPSHHGRKGVYVNVPAGQLLSGATATYGRQYALRRRQFCENNLFKLRTSHSRLKKLRPSEK